MMTGPQDKDRQDAADALANLVSSEQEAAEPAQGQAAEPAQAPPAGQGQPAAAVPADAANDPADALASPDVAAEEGFGEIELEDEPLMAEAVSAGPEGAGVFEAKRARQAALSGQQLQAKALFLRKTMLPILLVVGGLLLAIGVISIAMVTGAAPEDLETSNRGLLIAVAVLSFPLAACLFFGAWWFKRELPRDS